MIEYKEACKICRGRGRILSPDGPWTDQCECKNVSDPSEKKYKVVCYLRIDPDAPESMTIRQAQYEIEQARLLQPENIYIIEDDGGEIVVS